MALYPSKNFTNEDDRLSFVLVDPVDALICIKQALSLKDKE